jgi:AbrB family looped-hinge helix DNA binding protein
MSLATLTSKGQITIPRAVRDQLHLHAGDKIDFMVIDDGEVLLRPVTREVDEVYGCLNEAAAGKVASVAEKNAN